MQIRIGIDHGNKQIKTRNKTFISGLSVSNCKPAFTTGYIRLPNGKYYVLSNERMPYMRDKTLDERYYVLTLIAIAEELNARGIRGAVEAELGVGLPPEHLNALSQKFKNYLMSNNNYINYEYNGDMFSVKIVDVSVFPQGFAAAYNFIMENGKYYPTIYLIDIGGYTVDILEFNNGKVNFDRCQSKDSGVIPMYNSIIKAFRTEDIAISENEIDAVLLGRMTGLFFSADGMNKIRQTAQQHMNSLLYSLREEQYDLKSKYTIFLGGGCLLLENALNNSKLIGQHRLISEINANAVGYENMLDAMK